MNINFDLGRDMRLGTPDFYQAAYTNISGPYAYGTRSTSVITDGRYIYTASPRDRVQWNIEYDWCNSQTISDKPQKIEPDYSESKEITEFLEKFKIKEG